MSGSGSLSVLLAANLIHPAEGAGATGGIWTGIYLFQSVGQSSNLSSCAWNIVFPVWILYGPHNERIFSYPTGPKRLAGGLFLPANLSTLQRNISFVTL
ncbi:hypothetical protein ILYODFUR_031707 [Ilyodon furcidens]|uniref:Uncharacterized protein n=1 Tax=Ilyodon furcidens TaxID=33524 RepID=A0ABV0UYQ2_9TELE